MRYQVSISATGTSLLVRSTLVLLLILSCSHESPQMQQSVTTPTAVMVQSSGCRQTVSDREARYTATPDCIYLSYDKHHVLRLTHVNAVMNCCISGNSVSAVVSEGMIRITEQEKFEGTQPCRCLCLYDLVYEVRQVPPGLYTIRIEETNLPSGEPMLEGTVDLTSPITDTICVQHSNYRSLATSSFERRVPVPME
ncbi:MAG: hypothetical protein IPH75_10995 [bacterium]|nr:hypothetical protein [bacterium]